MKINVKNNVCCLDREDATDIQIRSVLFHYLSVTQRVKKPYYVGRKVRFRYEDERIDLYIEDEEKSDIYRFPRGLFELVDPDFKSLVKIEDASTHKYDLDLDFVSQTCVPSILRPEASFDLRDDQLLAVKKSLLLKRGVVQLPTGGGKTEVMAAIIKVLESKFPDINILVIEPTDILVKKTSERLNDYHLNSEIYKNIRDCELSESSVIVSHTKSLLNDCEKDPDLLKHIDVVFWDECQHCRCDTWKRLNFCLSNIEYAIGLSALAVDEKHLYEKSLTNLSLDEALIIGATGRVIMHIPPRYYIDQKILATPVIFQLENQINKSLEKSDQWAQLRSEGIESDSRSLLTAQVIKMFHHFGRRILVLVGTKKQAKKVAEFLTSIGGLNVYTGVSFGGGQSFTVDDSGEFVPTNLDIVSEFDKGNFSIIISTSHMDEGVDIKNLDVCVLASGGKKDRRIIQRIGRALRLTKTGSYAYIVDFFDEGSGILERHSRLRMKLFTDTVEVPKDLVFRRVSIDNALKNFKRLEELD